MNSFSEVFQLVKEHIVQNHQLSDTAYHIWIDPLKPIKLENNTASLYIEQPYHKQVLEENYLPYLKDAFEAVMGFPISVEILSSQNVAMPQSLSELSKEEAPAVSEYPPEPEKQSAEELFRTEEIYTFDNFIVGSRNEFAFTACKSIATNPSICDPSAKKPYNPLFIYGPSGLGKTHLLMAIKNEVKKHHPEMNILYTNSETFTNDLVYALKQQNIKDFHQKYRHADFFLIDDIQFLSGKDRSQEEFFHTFNELHQLGKQVVITSDRPPKEISVLEERLKSRFEWGLLADISPPDLETRIAIIKRKAEILEIDIPDDIANFIAGKLKNNIRQLEGAVNKIKVYHMLTGTATNLSVAQSVIKEILSDSQPIPVTIDKIIEEVARTYNVLPSDIRSQKRSGPISMARQIAIYITREITQIPMKEIGKEFGNRDHTTIVYTLKKVEELMKSNAHDRGIIEDMIKNIRDK